MKRLKIITILMFFIISMMVYIPVSKAAALTISTSQSNAKKGDSVTITVNGNGISGRVDLSIESGNGTLDEKSVWVDNSKATTTLTITGENDVRVLATPTDASDSATSAAYTQATSATIKVSKKDTTTQTTNEQNNSNNNNNNNNSETTATTTETKKSNNANLSDFGFKPNDFRGFKSGTLNYNATVPNDVEQVTIYAKLQDQKAKITSGTGAQKLNVGENKLSVVVTAEDGTTKTYTVNVTREEAKSDENATKNEITNEVTTDKNEDADLIKLEVEGYTLTPTFTPSVYEYKLDVSKDVKDLNVITEGANHNVSIELVGNTDLQEGENVVTVLVYNQETKKNTTYQILVNKVNANTEDMNNAMNDAIKKANFIRKILIGIFVFVVVAILAFIIIRRKFYYYDDYEYEDEEEAGADKFEEKLNLDEEEELFNRVNKDVFRKNTEKKKKEEKTQEQEDENDKIIEQKNTKEEDINLKDEKIETNKTRKKGKHF